MVWTSRTRGLQRGQSLDLLRARDLETLLQYSDTLFQFLFKIRVLQSSDLLQVLVLCRDHARLWTGIQVVATYDERPYKTVFLVASREPRE
jgi:succinylarginine dihydrolase